MAINPAVSDLMPMAKEIEQIIVKHLGLTERPALCIAFMCEHTEFKETHFVLNVGRPEAVDVFRAVADKLEASIKPTKLTAETVHRTFVDCLFDEGELTDNQIEAEGVQLHVGFHPERLAGHSDLIEQMLSELPDSFRKDGGGGMSFLAMCYDISGQQWADEHQTMDKLVCLGLASGKLSFLMKREFWITMPGEMPYIVVN